LADPAFSAPFTVSIEPAATSVIPLGWLVRFSVVPVPMLTLPKLLSMPTLATWPEFNSVRLE
jgi:hypothetical protein